MARLTGKPSRDVRRQVPVHKAWVKTEKWREFLGQIDSDWTRSLMNAKLSQDDVRAKLGAMTDRELAALCGALRRKTKDVIKPVDSIPNAVKRHIFSSVIMSTAPRKTSRARTARASDASASASASAGRAPAALSTMNLLDLRFASAYDKYVLTGKWRKLKMRPGWTGPLLAAALDRAAVTAILTALSRKQIGVLIGAMQRTTDDAMPEVDEIPKRTKRLVVEILLNDKQSATHTSAASACASSTSSGSSGSAEGGSSSSSSTGKSSGSSTGSTSAVLVVDKAAKQPQITGKRSSKAKAKAKAASKHAKASSSKRAKATVAKALSKKANKAKLKSASKKAAKQASRARRATSASSSSSGSSGSSRPAARRSTRASASSTRSRSTYRRSHASRSGHLHREQTSLVLVDERPRHSHRHSRRASARVLVPASAAFSASYSSLFEDYSDMPTLVYLMDSPSGSDSHAHSRRTRRVRQRVPVVRRRRSRR